VKSQICCRPLADILIELTIYLATPKKIKNKTAAVSSAKEHLPLIRSKRKLAKCSSRIRKKQ